MRWLDGKLNGDEFEQILGDSEGQGSLVCCNPWGCRVGHDLATKHTHNLRQQKYRRERKEKKRME